MAISVIQTFGATSGFTADYSVDLTSGATAGSSILIIVNDELQETISSFTFEGASCTLVWQGGTNNSKRIYRKDTLTSGDNTIRVVSSGVSRYGIVALEVTGLGDTDYVSGTFDATPQGDAVSHSIGYTSGGNNAFAVALICDQPADARTYTGTNGATAVHAGTAPQNTAVLYEDGVPAGAGSITCDLSSSGNRKGVAVTFLDSSPVVTFSGIEIIRTLVGVTH